MTDAIQVLEELRGFGTEQNRKIYQRHGVQTEMFGVSYANLRALNKKIKKDHALAQKLWATGNHDARVFATLIADPKQADEGMLESWVNDLGNYVIADALSAYVSKTPLALMKMERWTQSRDEWVGTVGWNLMAHLAMTHRSLSDDYFEQYLRVIERDIHNSKNRVRYAMNGALIAIGSRSADLERKALGVANTIGEVYVDHGETGCKTPDARAYIPKARARKK